MVEVSDSSCQRHSLTETTSPCKRLNYSTQYAFAVFGFNQADFIEDAINAAFNQSLVPSEILLVDDASIDETPQIMCQLADAYRGPAIIRVILNKSNQGYATNLSMVMGAAKVELVVIASADDISNPDRAQILVEAWENAGCPQVCVHSLAHSMDITGQDTGHIQGPWNLDALSNPEVMLRRGASMIGATIACPRSLFSRYGPFTVNGIGNTEDVALNFRSALEGGALFVNLPLIKYRVGSGISTKTFSSKEKFIHVRHALNRVEHSIACTEQMFRDVTVCDENHHLSDLLSNRRLVLKCVKASYNNKLRALCLAFQTITHALFHRGLALQRVLMRAIFRAVTGRL